MPLRSTKTWQVLASLGTWERKALALRLESPAVCPNPEVAALFKLLLPSWQNPGVATPSAEEAHAQLFPGKPFNHQRLRHLLTDLLRQAEEYMVCKELDADEALRTRLLLNQYRRRGLDKYLEQGLREANAEAERNPVQDSPALLHRFHLDEIAFDHVQTVQNRKPEEMLQGLLEKLEVASLAYKLRYACALVNRQNVLATPFNDAVVQDVIRRLEDGAAEQHPAIELYGHVLRSLLHEAEPAHYERLRAGLRERASAFQRNELGQLYAFALNYCIKRFNLGEAPYLRELYSLYQELIAGRILHEDGVLAPQHFKNIVAVAIRLEEFPWAEQFIREHLPDLAPPERRNAEVFNNASLAFARRQFSHAKRLLQQVTFTDPFYQLDGRTLLAKCYYELKEHEPLLSLIAAFRVFLRRDKTVSDYQKRLYLNLLVFLEKMTKARLDPDSPSGTWLSDALEAKEVADAAWLRRQAEAFTD